MAANVALANDISVPLLLLHIKNTKRIILHFRSQNWLVIFFAFLVCSFIKCIFLTPTRRSSFLFFLSLNSLAALLRLWMILGWPSPPFSSFFFLPKMDKPTSINKVLRDRYTHNGMELRALSFSLKFFSSQMAFFMLSMRGCFRSVLVLLFVYYVCTRLCQTS